MKTISSSSPTGVLVPSLELGLGLAKGLSSLSSRERLSGPIPDPALIPRVVPSISFRVGLEETPSLVWLGLVCG
jgi:hypothetical protein